MKYNHHGLPAIYATKQILNVICLSDIAVLTTLDDTRRVFAYLIYKDDWLELERLYERRARAGISPPRAHTHVIPVIMRSMISEPWLQKAGYVIKDTRRG